MAFGRVLVCGIELEFSIGLIESYGRKETIECRVESICIPHCVEHLTGALTL